MISMIAAVDENMGIGVNNGLLWQRDLPDDLRYFKRMTRGTSVIMGRKTFDGLKKPLPERENIVVSHRPVGVPGVLTAQSLPAAYELARYPVFIIGGGTIYQAAINDAERLYITEVKATFSEATVFFPAIDRQLWREVSREHHEKDDRNKYDHDFVVYERIT